MNLAVNHDRFGRDLSFEMGVLGNREGTIATDFSFDSPINKEIISKSDRSFNMHVVAKNIALSAGRADRGSSLLRSSGSSSSCCWCLRSSPGRCRRTGGLRRLRSFADYFFEHWIGNFVIRLVSYCGLFVKSEVTK